MLKPNSKTVAKLFNPNQVKKNKTKQSRFTGNTNYSTGRVGGVGGGLFQKSAMSRRD